MTTYRTIYADPPWPEYGGGKIKRGADRHYPLMKTSEIIGMGDFVRGLAEPAGSHLYLWVTNNRLATGLQVVEAWGFRYVTILTWAKDKFGLGYYFRGQTEQCLFGVMGKLPPACKDFNQDHYEGKRRWSGTRQKPGVQIPTTLISAPRGRHSVKPLSMYPLIEAVSPGPRIELFARDRREGWDAWGNEAPTTVQETL